MSESSILHSRMRTDTGTLVELHEIGEWLEFVFVESHRPSELVYALALTSTEATQLADMLTKALAALARLDGGREHTTEGGTA